jgi:hypothetical protein
MGKIGAKSKFTDVSCPNKDCKLYGVTGKENIIGNGVPLQKNYQIDTMK